MGESGSLVQPAGSAAFLSWGSSRAGMCLREQRHKQSKRKGKKQQEKEHVTLHCSSLNVKRLKK